MNLIWHFVCSFLVVWTRLYGCGFVLIEFSKNEMVCFKKNKTYSKNTDFFFLAAALRIFKFLSWGSPIIQSCYFSFCWRIAPLFRNIVVVVGGNFREIEIHEKVAVIVLSVGWCSIIVIYCIKQERLFSMNPSFFFLLGISFS